MDLNPPRPEGLPGLAAAQESGASQDFIQSLQHVPTLCSNRLVQAIGCTTKTTGGIAMVMMTAKVNKKRAILVLAALAALIVLICILAKGGGTENPAAPQEQPVSVATNDARVQYLTDYGWEVVHSPVQTQQVRIPSEVTDVYDRYNALQMSQGFNLTDYAGKTATRYVYEIKNYPNASDPVYATLLVYRDQVIGADITDTSANGVVQGLEMPG